MSNAPVMFDEVAIVGPGLIGASMGLALRERGLARKIVGIGRRQVSLDKALGVGAIDKATLDPAKGVRDADLVVLATPIRTLDTIMPVVAEHLKAETLVTDVASTKARVVDVVSSALRGRPDVSYIPTHPMAGGERSGPEAAAADLFEGAVCIITPLTNTFPESKSAIVRMWEAMGARTVSMTPQAHDRRTRPVRARTAGHDPHRQQQSRHLGRHLQEQPRADPRSPARLRRGAGEAGGQSG
jgi:prephenate dehydrogenase